jgi:ribosomal protein L7Ae-like RNA K-turn-binding protein
LADRILSLISLATKAGKVISGEQLCEEAMKNKRAHIVIVADDCSTRTKERFKGMGEYHGVDVIFYSNKEELGKYVGKAFRAVVAICDEGFAKSLRGKLASEDNR